MLDEDTTLDVNEGFSQVTLNFAAICQIQVISPWNSNLKVCPQYRDQQN